MHVDDVDVRKALEILSRDSSLNIMVSPGVTGKVTINLSGLTPDQTLDAILRLCNLVAQRDRGVIYVYTPDEMKKVGNNDGKPGIRVYRLNYIRSVDVEKMIKPFLTPKNGKVTVSPTSEIGIKGSSASSGSQGGGGSPGWKWRRLARRRHERRRVDWRDDGKRGGQHRRKPDGEWRSRRRSRRGIRAAPDRPAHSPNSTFSLRKC